MIEMLPLSVRLLISFLLGSIPFAVLAMRGTGINILRAGSGNPGFNNVLRYSKARAFVTLAGDFGKGVFAVALCWAPGEPYTIGWLCGFAAVLGHCYSPWLRLNGGKGIATSGGVMVVLYPLIALPCLAVFTGLRVTGAKRHWIEAGTIASLASWYLFAVLLTFTASQQEVACAAVMAAFVTWRHKKNFQILVSGLREQRSRSMAVSIAEEQ
jgi:glycerol-3-phosphate acyltransferase PlsY